MSQEKEARPQGILGWINRLCMTGGILCLLGMALIIIINVVGRYFFRSPLVATVELVGIAGALLISLSLLPCEVARRNISVPILTSKLSQGVLKVFNFSSYILSLLIVGVYVFTGAGLAFEMLTKREKTPVLELPVPIFRFIWVFGCILLFAVLLVHLIETLRGRK